MDKEKGLSEIAEQIETLNRNADRLGELLEKANNVFNPVLKSVPVPGGIAGNKADRPPMCPLAASLYNLNESFYDKLNSMEILIRSSAL